MLEAKSVTKQVVTAEGELTILNDISLQLSAGSSLSITGPSGSGKSTLLGILAGLDSATAGEVWLAGHNLSQLDEEGRARVRAEHVGFVFQSFQLLPGLTALENVALSLELQGVGQARDKAQQFLQRVGLQHRLGHYPRQLSGGEQQRVAIARAFASQPDILFADEPTGNLDTATGAHIIELLFELNRDHHTTLVLVTHEQRLADLCEQNIVIENGQVASGSLEAATLESQS